MLLVNYYIGVVYKVKKFVKQYVHVLAKNFFLHNCTRDGI